jgi:hypothetical protein
MVSTILIINGAVQKDLDRFACWKFYCSKSVQSSVEFGPAPGKRASWKVARAMELAFRPRPKRIHSRFSFS